MPNPSRLDRRSTDRGWAASSDWKRRAAVPTRFGAGYQRIRDRRTPLIRILTYAWPLYTYIRYVWQQAWCGL